MLDSTARAERIDLSASEGAYYTWEVAQKPVSVRLTLALIDRLESVAVENFRSLTSRGSEIGGILLGQAAPGNPAVVTVTDFELIACDYSRGPLYRLSETEQGRFEQAMEKHDSGSGARVMGYFRSHTRKGLSLDAEDLSFFEPRFLGPQQVILLVRPFATKASTAGIFIRENGRIAGETSLLEFPFRSAELTGGGAGKSEPAGNAAGAAAPVAPAAAAPPKAATRAQIVPIASRREITLPEPAAGALAPAPAVERLETPAPAPRVEPEKAEKAPVAAPAPPPPVAAAPAAPEGKAAAAVVVEETAAPAAKPGKNKKLRLTVAAALGMLVLVGGGLVVYPMLRKNLAGHTAAPHQDSSPLALRVERTPGGMLLTWNRDLPAIQTASKVVLSITDGDRQEQIPLDPNQVRTGSILYPPMTGDVSFQMEVTDAQQTKTTSESLRVLDPRPSPLTDPSQPDASSKTAAATKPATTTPSAPTTTASAPADTTPAVEPAPAEETPAPHTTPLKAFHSESLAERLRPATPADVPLPDAPTISRSTNTPAGSLAGLVPAQTALPPKPTPPPAPTPAPANVRVGGQITPAKVITRVDPEYPRLAQQSGASGLVELEATISTDGHVMNPKVTHGNVMLQKAAIDAVLQWRYKPAMLNGKPVESPVDIKLNFVPQH